MLATFTERLRKPVSADTPRRSVLITGASGRIGSHFAQAVHDRHELKLMVMDASTKEVDALRGCGTPVEAKLEDLEKPKEAFSGADTILHLAAEPPPLRTTTGYSRQIRS